MQELLRHGKFHYTLEFIVMNPGYSKENIEKIKENLKTMEIDAHIFDSKEGIESLSVSKETVDDNKVYKLTKKKAKEVEVSE